METIPRYSYFLRVDSERCKLYMREAGLIERTLAEKVGVSEGLITYWKSMDWPVLSLACTYMQVNPIALLRAHQEDDGRWNVRIDTARWLYYAQIAGYTVDRFAKELNLTRKTVIGLYHNERKTIWNSIEGLAYGLDVSPLALLRIDER